MKNCLKSAHVGSSIIVRSDAWNEKKSATSSPKINSEDSPKDTHVMFDRHLPRRKYAFVVSFVWRFRREHTNFYIAMKKKGRIFSFHRWKTSHPIKLGILSMLAIFMGKFTRKSQELVELSTLGGEGHSFLPHEIHGVSQQVSDRNWRWDT